MWSEKLKLGKPMLRSVIDAGYLVPKEVQIKTLSRIIGGQDIIAVGPEGSGKTTAYVLGILSRLKYGVEEAPRALVLAPDKDSVIAVAAQFALLNKNDTIRVVTLLNTPGTEAQMNALANGADIVIATPDRARAIYLKLGLNLNKIMMFVVDDAEQMIKQGFQLPINELANSIIKCQHLVFTTVMHGKLMQMIEPFIKMPSVIEIEELSEAQTEIHPQLLYNVPNFRTKVNLLNLLLRNVEVGVKTIIFVNTRLTAEKIFNSLQPVVKTKTALLNPVFFDSKGFEHIEDFKDQQAITILLAADELQGKLDLYRIGMLIHFELPVEKELFIPRAIKTGEDAKKLSIILSTDIELAEVKKIEQATGQKIYAAELPADLIIAKEHRDIETVKKSGRNKPDVIERGEAFHEKKDSNKKDYNYSAGTKAKMTKKKKHG